MMANGPGVGKVVHYFKLLQQFRNAADNTTKHIFHSSLNYRTQIT